MIISVSSRPAASGRLVSGVKVGDYNAARFAVAVFLLIVAVLAVSTSAPLVRLAEPVPALTVAAGRVCLAAVLLALASRRDLGVVLRLPRREQGLVVVAGLLLGAHFGVWIGSLYLTSTAASVALVATQPIFAALFGLALGDRVGARGAAGIAVAGVGCLLLAGGDLASEGRDAAIGDLLAVAGAVTAAGYLVVGRSLRVSLPLTPYLAAVNLVAALGLVVAAVAVGSPVRGFAPVDYAAIALSALIGSLLGHTLLNASVRRIPTHLVALAILGEPIGASLMTWAFFAEQPPAHAAAGGLVILAGIAIGFVRRRAPAPP
jgi:drug/metabolite transporter (DMT)-like permease